MDLTGKKDIILKQELNFANEIGAALFEKPKVSVWMIFIPILFLYFIFRMQKFKNDRTKFSTEFMAARREAMALAYDASAAKSPAGNDSVNRSAKLPEPLQEPYGSWIKALSSLYLDLLSADGNDFDSLVRTAYRNRVKYLDTLDRVNQSEKEFYAVLKPLMAEVEGTDTIIAILESESRRLRRDMADRIFC
ncbi:MAG: hypothetical protein A3J80_03290 [Desulfobacula sp. RIFOXYB2_FULL_45_6]|nr:MAG: hypothetical protein A3J80_03290 [Desulfobacula sp. RIFOXYB2_FULL_45_6]